MIELDVIEIEGTTVAVIELPTEIPVGTLAELADTCVPSWLVALIVSALAARELARLHRSPRR